MKILMLTPYLPYPLMSGGQTRSYNLLKNLSSEHEITLFSLIKEEKEKKYIRELEKFCKKVKVFQRSESPWTSRNIFLTGFSLYPFLVIRNLSPEQKKAVQEELENEKYDLIHAETFYVMPHIPRINIPILLVEQTIEYLVYKHYVEEQAPILLRPLLWIDIAKLRFWETYFWKRANGVVVMSESDRREMLKLQEGLSVDIVPNGIDVDYFSAKKKIADHIKKVLYVGNFKWLQNREAVELLTTRIWPKLKARIADVKLWIVGMGVTEEIKSLSASDIEVTEGIADIRDAYNGSDVLIAPIKGPGGTRLKILEAMASGIPVVTTTVGIEGLDAKDGKHALIRDTDEGLVGASVKVLQNAPLAHKLSVEAKKIVREKYNWGVSAKALDIIYRRLAKSQRDVFNT